MYKVPLAERLEITKYAHAVMAWETAKEILNGISDLQREDTSGSRLVLHTHLVSFYVLYSRPFKQRPVFRVDSEIVPHEMEKLHQSIISLRDKMFAHSDADFLSGDGDVLNRILVKVKDNSLALGNRFLAPHPDGGGHLELVDHLHKTAAYRRNKILERWKRHLRLPKNSVWSINIGTQSDDALLFEESDDNYDYSCS